MIVVGLALLAVLALWVARRRRKQAVLSGLVAERPQFFAEPPLRRHDTLKGQRL